MLYEKINLNPFIQVAMGLLMSKIGNNSPKKTLIVIFEDER
jgi:hypothetical protein